MPAIRIPERYKPGLTVLASLQEQDFNQLVDTLQKLPSPAKDEKDLAASASDVIKTISVSDLRSLIDTAASLYRLRARHSVTRERIAADVSEAASSDPALKLSPDVVRDRLLRLLSLDSFNLVTAKARELLLESEHMFCDARIITDLRPVFGSNVSDAPEVMIIVHTLRLGYHDSNSTQHRELFISLDSDDIAKLKDIAKRAEDKARSLKAKLDSSGIRSVDPA